MAIYCPGCATPATDDVKFCKKCGANLRAVVEALHSRTPDEWASRRAAMENPSRPEDLAAAELAQAADLQKEIKNGIITAFSGIGLTIFLLVFMGKLAAMQHDSGAATMLNSIWIAGIIPFLVGVGMLVNALFVGRRFSQHRQNILGSVFGSGALDLREPARITGELPALGAPPSAVPSVVEHTTRRLVEPGVVLRGRAQTE